MYQHSMNDKELIQPYKLGQINTTEFLQNLLSIFSFLNDITGEQKGAVSVDNISPYSAKNFAFSLLEGAWNANISLDALTASRFGHLITQAAAEPIYLISNTNELNVLKILRLLKQYCPQVNFYPSVDLSVKADSTPVEIAPNVFLCVSYRYQLFKTSEQNANAKAHSTTPLLTHLINNQLTADKSKITVVSQYEGDLKEAAKLGIEKTNSYHADDFFEATIALDKKLN